MPEEPFPCSGAPVADWIGKPWDAARTDEIRAKAKARAIRVVRPGDAVTMDFSPERLNVQLDEKGNIVGFNCG